MIKNMEIKNFKSIKELKQPCRRINIFVGEPNTGKSNILETIGMFSFGYYSPYGKNLKDFVRFERTSNLFYDENLDEEVQIKFDSTVFELGFKNGTFTGNWLQEGRRLFGFRSDYTNVRGFSGSIPSEVIPFKFYRFATKEVFKRPEADFLLPPSGDNLMSVILTHKELRTTANQIFLPFGLELSLRPLENKIEVLKRLEGITISYPYSLTSDTLQRVVFYLSALLYNKDSVLAFEEPEAHAFPYYTKYLAETIALDDRKNQFFISTHNPYFLLPLIEKAPKEDVAIFITYFEDYQTKTKLLNDEEMEEILEIDIFSNLDRFLEGR